ncbi:MAG TPA: hypothetical protein PKM50_05785 [Methanoregula sp.]|nr:hypothetical protein [Methanoregula sp.]
MSDPDADRDEVFRQISRHSGGVTVILIPLLIVIIWLLENYLLVGNTRLFEQASFTGLLIYTVLSCIIVGILVPFVRIRAAFLSGTINMFQIGFRSLRRTVTAISLTAIAACAVFVVMNMSGQGPDRGTGAALFIFLLPTAIAAVMICWGLLGTHVQAYFRSGGVIVSVFTGVLITALVFAISMSALFAGADFTGTFAGFLALGCVIGLFFFAVRDVYATIIVVTAGLAVLPVSSVDPAYLVPFNPAVALCNILATGTLLGVHLYFSRHYTTVMIPKK